MPTVTIGVPVRNGARFLPRAIESILSQTFTDIEVVISDNASTDATRTICEDYARRDPRVRYLRHLQNIGAVRNFNCLFSYASSPYFKWAAHDDMLAPTFIETGVRVLENDPSIVLYSPGTLLIDEDETPFSPGMAKDTYIDKGGNSWYWPAERDPNLASHDPADRFGAVVQTINMCFEIFGLIRSSALQRTALMDEYWGCDKVLLAELSLLGRFHADPQVLFHWRHHAAQSMHLSHRQQRRWVGQHRRTAFFQRSRKLLGYVNALRGKGLTLEQRFRCAQSMAYRSAKPGRIRQLIEEAIGKPA